MPYGERLICIILCKNIDLNLWFVILEKLNANSTKPMVDGKKSEKKKGNDAMIEMCPMTDNGFQDDANNLKIQEVRQDKISEELEPKKKNKSYRKVCDLESAYATDSEAETKPLLESEAKLKQTNQKKPEPQPESESEAESETESDPELEDECESEPTSEFKLPPLKHKLQHKYW
jgi:hypothetical protein